MSRRALGLSSYLLAFALLPGYAQAQPADPAIAAAQDLYGPPPPMEDCSKEQEAAIVSGEIIVCRRRGDQEKYRVSSDDEAENRYARETMNKGNPPPVDVAGPGIFRGPATVSGLCLIPPCPSPPAYMLDFDELPETPEGSDADRVGQGLAPRGTDAIAEDSARQRPDPSRE